MANHGLGAVVAATFRPGMASTRLQHTVPQTTRFECTGLRPTNTTPYRLLFFLGDHWLGAVEICVN